MPSYLRQRIAKAASISLADWAVLVESIATLAGVSAALRLVEFRRLVSWARKTNAMDVPDDLHRPDRVARIAWLVTLGGRLLHVRCLTRSLALTRVLARRGISADLRIGVRTEVARLQAHAWVEWRESVLNDSPRVIERYARFEDSLEGLHRV